MLETTGGQGASADADQLIAQLGGFTFRAHDDSQRSLAAASGAVENVTGYKARDLIGNQKAAFGDLVLQEDQGELEKAMARARGGQDSWRVTYRLQPSKGEPVAVQEHGRIVRDELGDIQAIEGMCLPMAGEADLAKQMQNLVSRLGQSSTEVINETDYILSVISKLRMLALNARIEAARAGEHGKGFQIVAEEMKQLANDSGEAADRITTTIRELRGVLADYSDEEAQQAAPKPGGGSGTSKGGANKGGGDEKESGQKKLGAPSGGGSGSGKSSGGGSGKSSGSGGGSAKGGSSRGRSGGGGKR